MGHVLRWRTIRHLPTTGAHLDSIELSKQSPIGKFNRAVLHPQLADLVHYFLTRHHRLW
jgi:hypothetical protein